MPLQALLIRGFEKRSEDALGRSRAVLGVGSGAGRVGSQTQPLWASGCMHPAFQRGISPAAGEDDCLELGRWKRTGRKGAKGSALHPEVPKPSWQKAEDGRVGIGGREQRMASWRESPPCDRPRGGLGAGYPRNGKPQCRGRGLGGRPQVGEGRTGKRERGKGCLNWERRRLEYGKEQGWG